MGDLEGTRFERLLRDEPVRKYLLEHHITLDNYHAHEAELRRFFPDEAAWKDFETQYLTRVPLLSYRAFLREGQRMDVFLHPRYIQQDFHIHDFFEMKYQLSGSGTVFLGSEMLFLKESDVCLISPCVPHRNEVYADDACMINLVLPAEYLPALLPRVLSFPNPLQDYLVTKQSEPEASANARWLYCPTRQNPEIRRIFEGLLTCFSHEKKPSLLRVLQAEADLERVFLWLLEQQPFPESPASPGQTGSLANQLAAFMNAHLADISLGDVAGHFHFSPSHMSRVIKRQTGFSFQTLLLILRLDAAAQQLRETALSVDQIASSVGLTGKTNFYEKFRAFYGVNPGAYRAQHRKQTDEDMATL